MRILCFQQWCFQISRSALQAQTSCSLVHTIRSASVQQWMNVAVELKYLKLLKNFGSAYQTVMTDFPSHSGPYKCVKGARTCPHLRHVIVHVKLLPTIVCMYLCTLATAVYALLAMHCTRHFSATLCCSSSWQCSRLTLHTQESESNKI